MEDLAAHRSEWVQPLSVGYRRQTGLGVARPMARAWRCWSPCRSSAGSICPPPPAPHPNADRYHLLIECMRRGFAVAARYVADPEHAELPLDQLLGGDFATRARAPRRSAPGQRSARGRGGTGACRGHHLPVRRRRRRQRLLLHRQQLHELRHRHRAARMRLLTAEPRRRVLAGPAPRQRPGTPASVLITPSSRA